jgi:hypothetical protein
VTIIIGVMLIVGIGNTKLNIGPKNHVQQS